MKGKLVIFSAPSGSGKTTIVKRILNAGFDLSFSISATTRPKRKGEEQAKDYYFMTVDKFRQYIAHDRFVEWEEVYKDLYYGTLKSEVERIRNNGQHVIFDVDVNGGINIKKMYPAESLAIFIRPPSLQELEKRLRNRSTDSESSIAERISKAKQELKLATEFDIEIVNDDLNKAVEEVKKILTDFLNHNK